jgi:hypothetical protein
MLAVQHRLEAFLDQPLTCPEDGREAGVQGRHDPAVTPAVACLGDIGLEQDPRLENRGRRALALVDQGFKRLTFLRAETDDVLLELRFWHDPIPDKVPTTLPESHRPSSESTT